jgi:hypothetical protein
MIFFERLCVTPILVDHKTDCVGKFISLVFHVYKERPNRRLYVTYTSILRQDGYDSKLETSMKCK